MLTQQPSLASRSATRTLAVQCLLFQMHHIQHINLLQGCSRYSVMSLPEMQLVVGGVLFQWMQFAPPAAPTVCCVFHQL
jgi:hypothetical protein